MLASPSRTLLGTLALGLVLTGCGKAGLRGSSNSAPVVKLAPVAGQGAVSVSTSNTTRLGGATAIVDAAEVARTVYPGFTQATRPQAVVLVNQRDWPAALAASVLASAPLNAPLLYSSGGSLPDLSAQTLQAMSPLGASSLGGAQVIGIGTAVSVPGGEVVDSLPAAGPAIQAAAIEHLLVRADGGVAPHQAIVLAAGAPRALQMPAASLAAQSGAPILFVTAAGVPAATATVLSALHHPSIYVIGSSQVGGRTLGELSHFGRVSSITSGSSSPGEDTVTGDAVAVARFREGSFGWGVRESGHGLVFANATRPLDAPAAALLSASGDYGPLLLLDSATQISPTLIGYLHDIQPGYSTAVPAVRAFYNHGWLIGDERAISAITQAELDSKLKVIQVEPSSEESTGAPVEQ